MSKPARIIKWAAVVAVAVIAIAGAFLALSRPTSNVTVANGSGKAMSNVRLAWAGKVVWTGEIPPYRTYEWHGSPGGEGSVELTFEVDDRKVSANCCYVTFSWASSIDFVVSPTLEVSAVDEVGHVTNAKKF